MDMAERLSELLGDENAMNQIQQLAQGLDANSISGLLGMMSGGGGLGGLLGGNGNSGSNGNCNSNCNCSGESNGGCNTAGCAPAGDPNIELLRALRPFLSSKRKKRASEAVKIMRMLELLPVLQQSGLLNNLVGGDEDD